MSLPLEEESALAEPPDVEAVGDGSGSFYIGKQFIVLEERADHGDKLHGV